MTEREVRLRFFGKTAVLWGLVDVQPATGELYRVRTLEVYAKQQRHVADGSEGIGAVPMK